MSEPDPTGTSISTSPARKLKTSDAPGGTGEKKRGVSFNDSVRVKTIEARKNSAKERLELFKRLGMLGVKSGDDDDSKNDDDD